MCVSGSEELGAICHVSVTSGRPSEPVSGRGECVHDILCCSELSGIIVGSGRCTVGDAVKPSGVSDGEVAPDIGCAPDVGSAPDVNGSADTCSPIDDECAVIDGCGSG